VALKMLLEGRRAGPEQQARFRTEYEALARLQHPNIVQIHEVGEVEGCPYFAQELVTGGTLTAALAGQPLPARAAAELVLVLARAIQHAHEHGVLHRDLKPANVLLSYPSPQPPPRSGEGGPEGPVRESAGAPPLSPPSPLRGGGPGGRGQPPL